MLIIPLVVTIMCCTDTWGKTDLILMPDRPFFGTAPELLDNPEYQDIMVR